MEDRTNFDHYVAQHYIKLFANDSNSVFVGDIDTKLVLPYSDVSRIMGRKNWSVAQSIEDGFTRIENEVAGALRTIKNDPSAIKGLAPITAKGLKNFICMHAARAVGIHDSVKQSNEQMLEVLRGISAAYAEKHTAALGDPSRQESLQHGISLGDAIQVALKLKGCVAVQPPTGYQFLLGDNPLATLSTQDHWYMRGGLPNRTTYLWFPLNPKLGLLFGKDLGPIIGDGHIKIVTAPYKLVHALNRSEVFLATQHIAGRKGIVKGKIRLPNVGRQRSKVTHLGWAPFIINENKSVFSVSEDLINSIRKQVKI